MITQNNLKVLLAELVGTFLLVFIGGGAGVAAALNGFSGGFGLLIAALAHGFALFLIVSVIGQISGAHVNPAVTISLAVIKKFSWSKVPQYIIAQFIGAFLATLAIIGIYGSKAVSVASASAPGLAANVSGMQGTLAEILGAFILIICVVAAAADSRLQLPNGWAGMVIGLGLAAAIFVAGPASGAGLNPALALSPYITSALFGGHVFAGEIPVYLFGPIIGGVVAALLYRYMADMNVVSATKRK